MLKAFYKWKQKDLKLFKTTQIYLIAQNNLDIQ